MRLEIVIPDSTKPEYKTKLANLAALLSAKPELIADIHLNSDAEDAAIQKLFTPELLAEIDSVGADMAAGKRRTPEEVDEMLAATRARWPAANPT